MVFLKNDIGVCRIIMILDVQLFTEVISSVFQLQVFVAIALGTVGGIIVGAIPGLTAVMAVALLLPFSFYLEPMVGIPFLIAIYKAAIFGGSIPAILICTPGTGAAIVTTLDGYPLTQRGEGGKAIKMAIWASVLGDTFSSVFVFILFAFGITQIVLFFGAPEMAVLLIMSFSLIAIVSQASLTKGLIAACFGMFFALIGQDPVTASQRFTFGILHLRNGLEIVPVMIGIFAIAEVMIQIERFTTSEQISITDVFLTSKLSWKEFKDNFPTMIRSSFIGFGIGAIPGLGQSIAAFLSYAVAKRLSPHPEKFGKGALEGVAAAESGNNAVNASTLIPLLTFGIPGDTVTAVLLGAFVAQGLTPGLRLFQDHGVVVFGILFAMVLTNIMLLLIALAGAGIFARVAITPLKFLVPIVLLLCLVGSYAVKNSMFDVGIMLIFGIFGYLLKKFVISPAPLLIAFILTRRLEMSLSQSLQISGGSFAIFFNRPISLVLVLITISIIGFSVYDTLKKNKAKEVM